MKMAPSGISDAPKKAAELYYLHVVASNKKTIF
jgi:hypothetical protein